MTIEKIRRPIVIEGAKREYLCTEYGLGKRPDGPLITPGDMVTADLAKINVQFAARHEHRCLDAVLRPGGVTMLPIPYTFPLVDGRMEGDRATITRAFAQTDLTLHDGNFEAPSEARALWAFAQLRQGKTFKKDDEVACLRVQPPRRRLLARDRRPRPLLGQLPLERFAGALPRGLRG
jgi:hypothetical protein